MGICSFANDVCSLLLVFLLRRCRRLYSHWFSVQHDQCVYIFFLPQWIQTFARLFSFSFFSILILYVQIMSVVCFSLVPAGALTIQFRLCNWVSFFNLCQLKIHKGKISSVNLEMGNRDSQSVHIHTVKYLQRKIIFTLSFVSVSSSSSSTSFTFK